MINSNDPSFFKTSIELIIGDDYAIYTDALKRATLFSYNYLYQYPCEAVSIYPQTVNSNLSISEAVYYNHYFNRHLSDKPTDDLIDDLEHLLDLVIDHNSELSTRDILILKKLSAQIRRKKVYKEDSLLSRVTRELYYSCCMILDGIEEA